MIRASIIFVVLISTNVYANSTIILAVWLDPPYAFIDAGETKGIEVDVVRELISRTDLSIEYKYCGFRMCMQWLAEGKADLQTGVFKTPEREENYIFIEYDNSDFAETKFFRLQHQNDITSFSGLKGLTIGVQKDVVYYPEFDNADSLIKKDYITIQDLVRALLNKEVDLFVYTGLELNELLRGFIKQPGKMIKEATYKHAAITPSYFIMSKKSQHTDRATEFAKLLHDMRNDGTVDRIKKDYLEPGTNE